jgi:hypothetical protein
VCGQSDCSAIKQNIAFIALKLPASMRTFQKGTPYGINGESIFLCRNEQKLAIALDLKLF